MSRRAALGVPVGIAAVVIVAVVATMLVGGGEGRRPARLPLSLAGSGSGTALAEDATADRKTAGAPTAPGSGPDYRFAVPVPDGLPDEADAFRLDDGDVDRDAVRRLADALGLAGQPITTERDAVVVREGEWVLRVSTTASRMWNFYREIAPSPGCSVPGAEPGTTPEQQKELDARCAGGGGGSDGSSGSDGTAGICLEGADSPCNDTPEADSSQGPDPSQEPTPAQRPEAPTSSSDQAVMSCAPPPTCPADTKCAAAPCGPYEEPKPLPLPAENTARTTAQRVFDATGVGRNATVRAERGYDAWFISATSRIRGLEVIGLGHHVSVGTDGEIRDASGSLATAEVLDRYPLVDAEAGLDRLEKQQSGFHTLALCEPESSCSAAAPEVLDVTDVRLGLLFSPTWLDEREVVFLVPAWVYEVKGRDYPEAVMAVTEEYLQTVAPEPEQGPETQVDPAQPQDMPAPVDPAQQPEPRPAYDSGAPEPAKS